MDGTALISGKFTSDGNTKQLSIRSDLDWMEVVNFTQASTTQTTGRGVKFYWQRGMASGAGLMETKQDSANAIDLEGLTSGGFTLLDTSSQVPESQKTGTNVTKAAPAVCTVTAHGYSTGDVVRIYNTDEMGQLNGLEFNITVSDANTFSLTNMDTNTGNFTASTSFNARRIPFNPIYYPRNRVITDMSAASSCIVTMAVTHGLTVGQIVRLKVPAGFGMVEADELKATVTAIGAADANSFTNTITLDLDTSSFTAFAWPAATSSPLTFAQVIPFGDDDTLDGATTNQSIVGMQLAAGADSPAGSTSDVIYWVAGKSEQVQN